MKPGWLVAQVTVLIAAGRAFADPLDPPLDAVALDYLQQGNRFYHLHDLAHAIDAYRAGSLRDEAPVFLFNLAQCHRQLGNYDESIWHYERFLSRARPTGELATTVALFITSMRSQQLSPEEARDPWYVDVAGWTLLGAGLATAATGAWLAVDANHLAAVAESEPQQSSRLDQRLAAASRRDLAITSGVVGGGLVIAGVIKLVLRDESSAPSSRVPDSPVRRSSHHRDRGWNLVITPRSIAAEEAF